MSIFEEIFVLIMPWVVGIVLVAAVLFIFVFIPYSIYDEYKAEKFYLRKDSWVCTKSHEETMYITNITYVGSTPIVTTVPSTHTVCDQWTRK